MDNNGWREITLGECVSLQRGHDLTEDERRPGNVPVIGAAGMNGYHDTAMTSGPGVVVGRSGASFGLVHYCPVDYWPHNTALYVTDFHGNDPRFCYYLLKSLDFSSYNSGSAQPSLNRNYIYSICIRVPPLSEQRSIAQLLGTLDDKIELNRRMNETLEAMARVIFKSWFVDFDPVRTKSEGRLAPGIAALFPSSFGDSPLGKIPKGWTLGKVSDLCESIANGGTPRRVEPEYWTGGKIPWFKTGELTDGPLLTSEEHITDLGLKESNCQLWPVNTILIALYASPTVGRLGILKVSGTANQACSALLAKSEVGYAFLFQTLIHIKDELQQIAVGSAQLNVSQEIVKNQIVLMPPRDLTTCYQKTLDPLYTEILSLMQQSLTQAALRDALLPKLISGELRVPNAEHIVGSHI